VDYNTLKYLICVDIAKFKQSFIFYFIVYKDCKTFSSPSRSLEFSQWVGCMRPTGWTALVYEKAIHESQSSIKWKEPRSTKEDKLCLETQFL